MEGYSVDIGTAPTLCCQRANIIMMKINAGVRLLEVGNRAKNNLAFVSRENFGGVSVHNFVVEELALIASAWQFWWIVLAAIPSGYSTGWCWQTGRTREQTVMLLLVAGLQLRGQVFVSSLARCSGFPSVRAVCDNIF